jgi:hypothetical protein
MEKYRRRSPKKTGTALAMILILTAYQDAADPTLRHGAMRLQIDTGKELYAVLPQRDAESAMDQRGILVPRPIARQSLRSELLSQDDGITDDSPMITALYEAHLSMEKMLAALAELRLDDAEGAIG